jgi:predicted XRE-type DNA-binding protein
MHAFEKRSRKTPIRQMEVVRARLQAGRVDGPRGGAMTRKAKLRVTRSTRNVFRDVGFSPGKAEQLQVRADLMIRIEKELGSRGLTHAKAAKLLGITQPRVSDLLRGRVELFSADALIDMLARLGIKVRIVASTRRGVA